MPILAPSTMDTVAAMATAISGFTGNYSVIGNSMKMWNCATVRSDTAIPETYPIRMADIVLDTISTVSRLEI